MARRRKKSKGRRKDQEEGAGASEESDAEGARAEESAGDEAEPEGSDEPGLGADAGPEVAAVIEVEEELDDPEARAELIDLAAGLESTGEEERPLIGRDVLVALSQFRDEGVATTPEELVLDLGDAASPEERDRLLAAALAHAEMQEAIYRVPTESGTTRRWKGLVAGALLVLALLIISFPPDFVVPEAPPALSTSERVRSLRTALLLQAEQIESFRAREDRLPRSLDEVETALPGIRYVRSSDRLYQLVTHTPGGEAIIFDSAAPDADFGEPGGVLPQRPSS